MKKTFLLAIFIIATVSNSLMAQLAIGFKTSPLILNTSKMVGTYHNITQNKSADDYDSYSPLLNLGFTMKYTFKNSTTLSTEFTYKMQGFQDKSTSEIFKLDYIEIPLLAGYSFGDKTKFFVQAGPSVKFLTRGDHEYISNGSTEDYDIKSSLVLFKPAVLVANVGVGVSRQISDLISVNLEYRFGYDLSTVTGDTTDDDDDDYNGDKTLESGDEWSFEDTHLTQTALTVGIAFHF